MKAYTILSTALLLLASCGNKQTESYTTVNEKNTTRIELTDAQLKNADIRTAKLDLHQLSALLTVNGTVDVPPQNMVSISIPLGGYVKSTHLLPGMKINKGETIAVVEDQQYITIQQEYLMANVKLKTAEEEFLRQGELNKSKATSDKTFRQAEADYVSQKILIKSLSEKLKLIGINPGKLNEANLSKSIQITSPIDGFVSKVNVNIGKYANPADILFELVNPTDIHLALTVFEKDIDKLAIGQKLYAFTNTRPEKKYPCEIILIGKNLSQDRTVSVRCHFKQYEKTLIPGLFMNANIEVTNTHALAIPSEAIVRFEGKNYLFEAVNQHTFSMIEVTTGMTEQNYTEIQPKSHTNLREKSFVIKGAYTLLMTLKNKTEE